jgi:hypothetical protein
LNFGDSTTTGISPYVTTLAPYSTAGSSGTNLPNGQTWRCMGYCGNGEATLFVRIS